MNLRQETKALFLKFGRIKQFFISDKHESEQFTETYHVIYERIQSARYAKKMLDTRNFYGGSLHICYAPELESLQETREKLMQRHRDVFSRLKMNSIDTSMMKTPELPVEENDIPKTMLNMGEFNTIVVGKTVKGNLKRKNNDSTPAVINKHFKPCFVANELNVSTNINMNSVATTKNDTGLPIVEAEECSKEIDLEKTLNYSQFGNEIVRKINHKPLNRINFNVKNKKL